MPRPKIDTTILTNQLLDEAERVLAETQGRRLVLSELAARIGISQPYVHRFFPTKADLVKALAKRWFDEVEKESQKIANLEMPAIERLEAWLLAILRLKRNKFDEDPKLFLAYLDLAKDHMDLVRIHTQRLSDDLRHILSELVLKEELTQTIRLVEDATLLFRTPSNISQYRASATDERAKAVVRLLVAQLTAK